MKKHLNSILIGLLLVLCAVLIFQNIRLRNSYGECLQIVNSNPNKDNTFDVHKIKKIISDKFGDEIKRSTSPWNLVIIFAPEDCPVCLDELTYWDNISRTTNALRLWGIINHKNRQLCEKFIAQMGWQFPFYIDEDKTEEDNFGLKHTPIKVLLNSERKIILLEGANTQWMTDGRTKNFLENTLPSSSTEYYPVY